MSLNDKLIPVGQKFWCSKNPGTHYWLLNDVMKVEFQPLKGRLGLFEVEI
jgi:hypothetical protein